MRTLLVASAVLGFTSFALGASFDGASDYGTGSYGYYYLITGGKFPTGNTPNGDNGSGGTFRFVTDDPVTWGRPLAQSGQWQKDDWFAQNAGFAVTMKNGATTVYDNNGIDDGSHGNYYNAQAQGTADAATPGLYRGYSMSNNFDWIYAGYFKLTSDTTVTEISGYFDENSGFDRFDPNIEYRMNIWSNVAGDLLPTNTGSFDGDVLAMSGKLAGGKFSVSDTGVSRVFADGATDPIFRLTYTFDAPITLAAGEYWFSHDATISPVPLPAAAWGGAVLCGMIAMRRKRGQTVA